MATRIKPSAGGRAGYVMSDMFFASEPTAAADDEAVYLRRWYEANRETWWWRRQRRWEGPWADNFMLALMQEANRIREARKAQASMTGAS